MNPTTRSPEHPDYADTTRTPEQLGRDAVGRTEAKVIGTNTEDTIPGWTR